MIPRYNDNSLEAQAFRKAAVDSNDCPKCGATKGHGCSTANGGSYDQRYWVHHARLLIAADDKR